MVGGQHQTPSGVVSGGCRFGGDWSPHRCLGVDRPFEITQRRIPPIGRHRACIIGGGHHRARHPGPVGIGPFARPQRQWGAGAWIGQYPPIVGGMPVSHHARPSKPRCHAHWPAKGHRWLHAPQGSPCMGMEESGLVWTLGGRRSIDRRLALPCMVAKGGGLGPVPKAITRSHTWGGTNT